MSENPQKSGLDLEDRLSRISTQWSMLAQASAVSGDAAVAAQRELFQRYSAAVYRYLFKSLGNGDAADEVFQEFSLRLVRGDFKTADPERGRFRAFLKRVLHNLIADHWRRRQRAADSLPDDGELPATSPTEADEEAFRDSWREELLARTWAALLEAESVAGKPLHKALRLRADHPKATSEELAGHLSKHLGKTVTAGAYRKHLLHARERFADLLVAEVARTMSTPSRDNLLAELAEMGLLGRCKEAAERWRSGR